MGEDESRPTRLRLLDAARYVVATVVAALTIAVIAWAIVLFRRPEEPYFSVGSGYVTVSKISHPPPIFVNLSLQIKAMNPSTSAAILYANVTAYFWYPNLTDTTYFYIGDIWVAPQFEHDDTYVTSDVLLPVYAEQIFKGSGPGIRNTTLTLEGTIQAQTSALNYTSSRYTEYYCSPVTIGTSPPQNKADDVPCRTYG